VGRMPRVAHDPPTIRSGHGSPWGGLGIGVFSCKRVHAISGPRTYLLHWPPWCTYMAIGEPKGRPCFECHLATCRDRRSQASPKAAQHRSTSEQPSDDCVVESISDPGMQSILYCNLQFAWWPRGREFLNYAAHFDVLQFCQFSSIGR
jgi:hypothetical protein